LEWGWEDSFWGADDGLGAPEGLAAVGDLGV
jgi:hypothetical protein